MVCGVEGLGAATVVGTKVDTDGTSGPRNEDTRGSSNSAVIPPIIGSTLRSRNDFTRPLRVDLDPLETSAETVTGGPLDSSSAVRGRTLPPVDFAGRSRWCWPW